MSNIDKAKLIATVAHGACGHKRKHSGIAYINHPADVVKILTDHSTILSRRMICAAWLHDVVEDTEITIDYIHQEFDTAIARIVYGLTNDKNFKGNRAERHANNLRRLSFCDADVQTIKLADIIANSRDIIRDDPAFAPTYLAEKAEALTVLTRGCSVLWGIANSIIGDYFAQQRK